MKISVIIPVYNGEKYLAQCLDNMLCQTYKDLEIIVINDGSTDKSSEIAEKYPVKIIHHEKNSGLSVARNTGIDNATGDYIHFMDVDDWISLDFYEKISSVSLLTDADMVLSEFFHERLPDISQLFNDKIVVSNIEDKLLLTKVRRHGYCWRYLFKLNFLKANGLRFDANQRFMEDTLFSLQAVFLANKIATAPKAVYYYKYREQSIINSKNKEHHRKVREFKRKMHHLCDEFLRQHGLEHVVVSPQKVQYKLFGIPLLKKLILTTGKERWYLFGIYFLQRKNINK